MFFRCFLGVLAFLVLCGSVDLSAQEPPPAPLTKKSQAREAELIRSHKWNQKTVRELEKESENLDSDIALMQTRLGQLRGLTRLNQDQYREKEILDELVEKKEMESAVLKKILNKRKEEEKP
jgi:hypothetical protein